MKQWVDSVFDSMSVDERVGQLFVLGSELRPTPQHKALLKRYITELKIGGILFTKGSIDEQIDLTNYCQSIAKVPLMVTFDGEWGLAMRLTDAPQFPVNLTLGALDNDSLIYEYGKEVGRQCKLMGVHVNFAPVLDVNSNPKNPVIGRRSFGEDPETVARKAIAYAKGLESEGVLAVGKHFPGHGDTSEDSHYTLPVVSYDLKRLKQIELLPFERYINAGLSGLLTAHLSVPALDPSGQPSSLSPAIVDTLLRQQMKFEGLVFTDALEMKGSAGYNDQAIKAILAGNDVILKPNLPFSQIKAVMEAVKKGEIPMQLIEEKCLKILQYKYLLGINKSVKIDNKQVKQAINTPATEWLNRQLYAGAITLLTNTNNLIPLRNLAGRQILSISIGENSPTVFQQFLQQYDKVSTLSLTGKTPEAEINLALNKLDNYNTVIVGVHSVKSADLQVVRNICQRHKVILVLFAAPNWLTSLKEELPQAEAVIMGYENTKLAQEYAAQLLFGGIGAKGKLPITINDLYAYKAGLVTTPTRLGYSVPEEVGMSSQQMKKIDQIVKEGIEAKAFPGCQVLVARRGKIIYNRSFGYFDYANTKAVSNNDVYDLASITKATATLPAIMELCDEYKIGIHQKLSTYIPELKKTDKKEISLKDALYHESGMPPIISINSLAIDTASYPQSLFKKTRDANYRLQADKQLFAYKDIRLRSDLVADTFSKDFSLPIAENINGLYSLPDTIFDRISKAKLRQPGKYLYSCLNFSLLKKVVENVSKQPINVFVERQFYKPLGANHLTYNPLKKLPRSSIAPTEHDQYLRKQLLVGYVHDEMAAFSGGVEGNAGLFGNANDLAKLLQLYLNNGTYGGERFMREETVKQFTESKSALSRRGLGFDKPDKKNPAISPVCPEAPASVYGHTGFTGGCFWVDPDNDLIYIFLSNRVYQHRWNSNLTNLNIRPRIQSVIYQSITDK